MLVTRLLSGRPYQSYVPKPLIPSFGKQDVGLGCRMDRWLATTCDAPAFAATLVDAVAQPGNRPNAASGTAGIHRAAEYLLSRERAGIKHLKNTNALLLGQETAEFRTKPVWIGAPHPSASWHVGSPPDMLNGLVKNLLAAPPPVQPASLTAMVLLFRLLQIHPFQDGNGRTARLWSTHAIHRHIGPACGYLQILDKLWDRAKVDINSLSLETQTENSFAPVFAYLETALKDHL